MIPFSLPPYCGLLNIFPSPAGQLIVIELSCPEGQTVLLLNVEDSSLTQPVIDADSHFLAWMENGKSVALRLDSLGDPRIVRLNVDTRAGEDISISGFTYDLAARSDTDQFSFTLSRGLGSGSEMQAGPALDRSFNRCMSIHITTCRTQRGLPDAKQIAFIKIPDTQTPFTVGELWVMDADGSDPRKLAEADAGHGYAANWSPDGKRIAFVVRENPEEERANLSSEALLSNIYTVEVESGALTRVTDLTDGYVETPFWSPQGNTLAFTAVINDRMEVRIADLNTGEIRSLGTEATCCPAWLRK